LVKSGDINRVEKMVLKIVSGGQSGVDRAALDFALGKGISCGGWCPRGRLAEDGPISSRYPLQEMPNSDYAARTHQNIVDSDGTLILNLGELTGGTALTERLALKLEKPLRVVFLDQDWRIFDLLQWLKDENIGVLNVAGPRASKEPQVYAETLRFLSELFNQV
jgi:hypothetical protein